MANYAVYHGAAGWEHAHWQGDFYPEDLPADWQLPFYNTRFRCVYLSYAVWWQATDEQVAGWLHDTLEGFHFVLGGREGLDAGDAAVASRFGARGIAEAGADICWLEGGADLRALARRMQAAARSGVPLYVISRAGALAELRRVGELMQVLGV